MHGVTLPETNCLHLTRMAGPKRKGLFSNHQFSGATFWGFKEGSFFYRVVGKFWKTVVLMVSGRLSPSVSWGKRGKVSENSTEVFVC